MTMAAITEAFSLWICPAFLRRLMTMGILPMISITAKSTILAVKISFKLRSMPEVCHKTTQTNYPLWASTTLN